MERVQRIGLIALVVLIAVAAVGLVIGPKLRKDRDSADQTAALDSGAMPKTSLVPPDLQSVTPASFQAPPVKHPVTGGSGPGPNQMMGTDYSDLPQSNSYAAGADPVSPAAGRSVLVREGDTLEKIARRELGDGGRWNELAQLNGIRDPRKIRVGQTLQLPGAAAAAPGAGPSGPSTPSGAAQPPADRSYVVKSGDTLSKISAAVYGTSKHWQWIQDANGIQDARSLRVGQTLRIPPPPQ